MLKQIGSYLKDGMEYLSNKPRVQKTSLRMPQSSVLRTRQLIRQQMSQMAAEQGQETFEEADDFAFESEEWVSPYEADFERPLETSSPEDSAEGKTASSPDADISYNNDAPNV